MINRIIMIKRRWFMLLILFIGALAFSGFSDNSRTVSYNKNEIELNLKKGTQTKSIHHFHVASINIDQLQYTYPKSKNLKQYIVRLLIRSKWAECHMHPLQVKCRSFLYSNLTVPCSNDDDENSKA